MIKSISYLHFSFFFIFLLVTLNPLRAQLYGQPSNYQFSLLTQKQLAQPDSSIHSGILPYIPFFSKKYEAVADSHRLFKYITRDVALDKTFYTDLIDLHLKEPKFNLRINPLLNLELGRDTRDTTPSRLYTNTRGFMVSGTVGNDFYFESTFAESQSFLPDYLSNYAKASTIIPGQGRWKIFKTTGFDYANSAGIVSWQANKHLNIQAGHGKQKIGDGYRSLLLSDNSFNYPYIRFTQQWWKGRLQYSHIYASLMNLVSASTTIPANTERLFQKKAAAFQYLSLNLHKRLNIGFFQGLIWQTPDSKNRMRLGWEYFNPILYSNLAVLGLNNANNLLVGTTLRLVPFKNVVVYAQWMADDLSNQLKTGNGWGVQGGVKYFDAFTIKNLCLQTEYNQVFGSAYQSPVNSSMQDYSHYGQTLAFTPFRGSEFLMLGDYKFKRVFINARYHFQNMGGTQKILPSTTSILNASIGYLINPAYNLNINMGLLSRSQMVSLVKGFDSYTNYIYFSIRTSLFNTYYDF